MKGRSCVKAPSCSAPDQKNLNKFLVQNIDHNSRTLTLERRLGRSLARPSYSVAMAQHGSAMVMKLWLFAS